MPRNSLPIRVLLDSVGFCWPECPSPAIFAITHFQLVVLGGVSRRGPQWRRRKQENMQEQERWLSVEEIAAHLGVNRDTIYKWIERKQMPAHKLGKLWKFKATEVDEWIRQGKAGETDNSSEK